MVAQNPAPENFESTAQLMLTVLDKAEADLAKIIGECVEMVSVSGFSFQNTLMSQLRSISEKYQISVDGQSDNLEKTKEQILAKLQKFEERQVEAIESTATIVRQALVEHTDELASTISRQLNEHFDPILGIRKDSDVVLTESYDAAMAAIEQNNNRYQQQLQKSFDSCEAPTGAKFDTSVGRLTAELTKWKRSTEKRISEVLDSFQQRSNSTLEEVETLSTKTMSALNTQCREALESADNAVAAEFTAVDKPFEDWESGLASAQKKLHRVLRDKKKENRARARVGFDTHLSESTSCLTHLSGDASESIRKTQEASLASLKKLEANYIQRLEHLREHFDRVFAESRQQSDALPQTASESLAEHKERLQNNLAAQSEQISLAAANLASQLESDLKSFDELLVERIESVKGEVIENFKEQVRLTEIETERSKKAFQRDIAKLQDLLREIDDAGDAAAVTVTAFRSAGLSLEED